MGSTSIACCLVLLSALLGASGSSEGLVVLLGLLASATAQDPCSGTFSASEGAYNAMWTVEGDDITFTVSAQTTTWIGIGFSLDQSMISTDTVVGGVFEGTPFAYDGYATARAQPPKDTQQDIEDVMVAQEGGVTTLQFTRKRVTGDSNDLPLDGPFYFLFAWNGGVSGVDMIGYHGFGTRGASPELVTLPTAQQCPAPTPPTPSPAPTPTPTPGCFFEIGQVVLRPAFVRLSYTAEQVSSVQCSIDDGDFVDCPDGTELVLAEGGVHSLNFAIVCDSGFNFMEGPFLVNAPEPEECEAARVSRIQLRRSFDVHRMLSFSWRTTGEVHYTKCQIDQSDEFETTSPYDLPLFDRCESRMRMTVNAYCNGRVIATRTKKFHNFNGLSCDHGCSNISFTSVPTMTYNAATSTVAVDFDTTVPAKCSCREKKAGKFVDCADVPVTKTSGIVIISCRTVDNCRTVIRNYLEYP